MEAPMQVRDKLDNWDTSLLIMQLMISDLNSHGSCMMANANVI